MLLEVGNKLYNLDKFYCLYVEGQDGILYGLFENGHSVEIYVDHDCNDNVWNAYTAIITGMERGIKHMKIPV